MSLPEATFVWLECAPPDVHEGATTWVHFTHTCEARRGQEGYARFLDKLGNTGDSTCWNGETRGTRCCRIIVPSELWGAWQQRSEFVRLVQQARAVEYERKSYVG